jgi:hypothetical protein
LVLAFLVMGFFVFPALAAGQAPLAVGLVGCSLIMFVVLYLAHGVSAQDIGGADRHRVGPAADRRAGSALHTWCRVGGDWATNPRTRCTRSCRTVSLSGIVVVGMLIAGLGVLNDVTVTQASAVWELAETDPGLGARALFGRAMRIGPRPHRLHGLHHRVRLRRVRLRVADGDEPVRAAGGCSC